MIDKSISESRNHSPPSPENSSGGQALLIYPSSHTLIHSYTHLRESSDSLYPIFFIHTFPGPFQMIVSAMAIIKMIAEDVLDIW